MSDDQPGNKETSGKELPAEFVAAQFKPGQSGNPSGRPKKKPITELYEEILADEGLRPLLRGAIVKRMLSERMVGGLELKEMAERVEGKVSQSVEVNGELILSLSERMQRARERAAK